MVEGTNNLVGVLSGESPGEPYRFSMRGFDRDSVQLLYDGFSSGRAALNMRPLSASGLDRIEIVKSPVAFHHDHAGREGTSQSVPRPPNPGGSLECHVVHS